MFKHICFDFDGVILDSMDLHIQNFQEVFGVTFTREEYATFLDGNFHDSAIARVYDWKAYNRALEEKYQNLQLDPLVIQSLQALAQDYQLSINSSAGDEVLDFILERNKVRGLFAAVWGTWTEPRKTKKFSMLMETYGLEPDEILFVTDTLGDIREAQEVDISVVAITGGFHDRARLESGEPNGIVESWGELLQAIDRMQSK